MARTSIVLCRYTVEYVDSPLSWREQLKLLDELKLAKPIAYRKSDPGPEDYDTYIMRTDGKDIDGYYAIVLDVVRDVRFRQITKADRERQTVTAEFQSTDEVELSHVVIVPELGAMAVEDGTGEGRLPGMSAARRLQAVVQSAHGHVMSVTQAGSPQDLQRAISTWDLDQFTFEARPFNPHPSNPGEQLSELMAQDGIGVFRGVALPKEGAHIQPKTEGMVQEALGLAANGYATYGTRGTTPSGAEAVVQKQPFSHDRKKNLERLAGPQKLRVYVDPEDESDLELRSVQVLAEFFGAVDEK